MIRLYNRTLPALVPGGYNWVDVRDVVKGAVSAMEKGRQGERYILSGHYVSVKELAKLIEKVTDRKTTRLLIPTSMAKAGVPFIKAYATITHNEPLYTFSSLRTLREGNQKIIHEKASRELSYNPRDLELTIRDTLDWFKAHDYIK